MKFGTEKQECDVCNKIIPYKLKLLNYTLWYSVKLLIHVYPVIKFITAWITLTFVFIVIIIWNSLFLPYVDIHYTYHTRFCLPVTTFQMTESWVLTCLSYCWQNDGCRYVPKFMWLDISEFLSVLYLHCIGYFLSLIHI